MADGLETRNLRHPETCFCNPHIDQRLHLEPVSPEHCASVTPLDFSRIEPHDVEALSPERVVAVAEVRVVSSVEQVDDSVEPEVADSPEQLMSRLPPPVTNLDPLAKSAPVFRAVMKRGISAGSFEPSASIMTMKSPVAAAKPQARAFPLPSRVWPITVMSGLRRWATLMVSSIEFPSTRITSQFPGRPAKTCGRFRASFFAGITMLSAGSVFRGPCMGRTRGIASNGLV